MWASKSARKRRAFGSPVRRLPTVGRKQATRGSPHVGGQSADDGEGQRPEGKVEEQGSRPELREPIRLLAPRYLPELSHRALSTLSGGIRSPRRGTLDRHNRHTISQGTVSGGVNRAKNRVVPRVPASSRIWIGLRQRRLLRPSENLLRSSAVARFGRGPITGQSKCRAMPLGVFKAHPAWSRPRSTSAPTSVFSAMSNRDREKFAEFVQRYDTIVSEARFSVRDVS